MDPLTFRSEWRGSSLSRDAPKQRPLSSLYRVRGKPIQRFLQGVVANAGKVSVQREENLAPDSDSCSEDNERTESGDITGQEGHVMLLSSNRRHSPRQLLVRAVPAP